MTNKFDKVELDEKQQTQFRVKILQSCKRID